MSAPPEHSCSFQGVILALHPHWLLAKELCLWSGKTSWCSRTDKTLQNSLGLLQPAVFSSASGRRVRRSGCCDLTRRLIYGENESTIPLGKGCFIFGLIRDTCYFPEVPFFIRRCVALVWLPKMTSICMKVFVCNHMNKQYVYSPCILGCWACSDLGWSLSTEFDFSCRVLRCTRHDWLWCPGLSSLVSLGRGKCEILEGIKSLQRSFCCVCMAGDQARCSVLSLSKSMVVACHWDLGHSGCTSKTSDFSALMRGRKVPHRWCSSCYPAGEAGMLHNTAKKTGDTWKNKCGLGELYGAW